MAGHVRDLAYFPRGPLSCMQIFITVYVIQKAVHGVQTVCNGDTREYVKEEVARQRKRHEKDVDKAPAATGH